MKKIYSELSRIQQELKAPKNLFNKFGNYKYRNAEGILESVKPLLNGLALVINDEPVAIGDRFYIKATVTLTDGEESVSAVAYAREDETKKGMDGCQITGACSSYARKYALNALLMIDDSKDSDDDSLSPKNPANRENKPQDEYTEPKAQIPKAGSLPKVDKAKAGSSVAGSFLTSKIAAMQERMNVESYDQMRAIFTGWVNKLVESGSLAPVDWKNLTIEDAENIVSAVETVFMEESA